MNNITLKGRLIKDSEYKDGGSYQLAKLAIAYSKKNKDGEWQGHIFNVDFWNFVAQKARVLKKGDTVVLNGELLSESYEDKNGNKRTSVKIRGVSYCKVEKMEKQPQQATASF